MGISSSTPGGDTKWTFCIDAPGGLKNSWTEYDNTGTWGRPCFRKLSNGQVELRGLVKCGGPGGIIFTLPPGYRLGPLSGGALVFVVMGGTNGAVRIDLDLAGNVTLNGGAAVASGNFVSLAGIQFYAEA